MIQLLNNNKKKTYDAETFQIAINKVATRKVAKIYNIRKKSIVQKNKN